MSSSDCSVVIQSFMESNAAFMVINNEADNFVDEEEQMEANTAVTGLAKRLIDKVNANIF